MTMHPGIRNTRILQNAIACVLYLPSYGYSQTHIHTCTVSLALSYVSDNARLITRCFSRFGIRTCMHACIPIRIGRIRVYRQGEILKVPANDGSVGPINAVGPRLAQLYRQSKFALMLLLLLLLLLCLKSACREGGRDTRLGQRSSF